MGDKNILGMSDQRLEDIAFDLFRSATDKRASDLLIAKRNAARALGIATYLEHMELIDLSCDFLDCHCADRKEYDDWRAYGHGYLTMLGNLVGNARSAIDGGKEQ